MALSKKKTVGKKILKIAGIISAVFLSLILILTILLLTVLEPYAEYLLKSRPLKTN